MIPARELAVGKWQGLLGKWMTERMLSGKHGPCPLCKTGKDKFRFDDKDGLGTWYCNSCEAGDGFMFLQQINDWTFQEAAQYVERECGKIQAKPVAPGRSEDDIRGDLRRVWGEAKRIELGDAVWLYLVARCSIKTAPQGLRFHPELSYRHDDGKVTKHPAMLAQVLGADAAPVSIHRTYLTADGTKADLNPPRKMMTPVRKMDNAAVRLMAPADGWLGVAEGIETALCASKRHDGMPVWACTSAGLMKSFRPPDNVKFLAVYADNDFSFTGQAAAYELARAVSLMGVEVKVLVPETDGKDWADT